MREDAVFGLRHRKNKRVESYKRVNSLDNSQWEDVSTSAINESKDRKLSSTNSLPSKPPEDLLGETELVKEEGYRSKSPGPSRKGL